MSEMGLEICCFDKIFRFVIIIFVEGEAGSSILLRLFSTYKVIVVTKDNQKEGVIPSFN